MSGAFQERGLLANKIRRARQATAETITEEFFRNHQSGPIARMGERGRAFCLEDAGYHLDFLAGALQAGAPQAFHGYVRWTSNVLRARAIPPQCLLENLRLLALVLERQLEPGEMSQLRAYLELGQEALEDLLESAPQGDEDLLLSQQLYQQAILGGHRKVAWNVVREALRAGHQLPDVYIAILQESLYAVGRLWETNQISVAQEHMATAITQFVVAQLYGTIQPAISTRGKAMITGVQGELHQVGSHMVADMLEIDGWDVRFLGTNMPHEGILRAVKEQGSDVLGISTTMLFNIPQVADLITRVRDDMKEQAPRILVGGGAFRQAPDLWREIGADHFGLDLKAALSIAKNDSQDIPDGET